jgi:hypothetical protein
MADTSGVALDRLRDLLHEQVDGYRSLLEATRAGTRAIRERDPQAFERILAEQVETLRRLKELERERSGMITGAGEGDDGHAELARDLRELARRVSRESRISRLVIERNGALVEARLALHRRAGTAPLESRGGLDHVA